MGESPEVQRRFKPLARFLDALRRDPASRRRVLLWTIGVSVAVVTVATVVLTVLALSSSADTADKLAAAGDVLVGATLVLAAIAAVVALLAYAVSTGSPDLQISVQFTNSPPNNPVLKGSVIDGNVAISDPAGNLGKVLLRNDSGYSAKNPTVIVRLHAMAFLPGNTSFFQDWASMDVADISPDRTISGLITVVQWDGGPTYSIHGNSARRLPDLQFTRLWVIPNQGWPALTFEILADGYRKEITFQVDFIAKGKPQYSREKANPKWM